MGSVIFLSLGSLWSPSKFLHILERFWNKNLLFSFNTISGKKKIVKKFFWLSFPSESFFLSSFISISFYSFRIKLFPLKYCERDYCPPFPSKRKWAYLLYWWATYRFSYLIKNVFLLFKYQFFFFYKSVWHCWNVWFTLFNKTKS